ncbi:MAG TPA: transcription termination/antitermination protein NusA [Thermodesulfobacteriaceae bacterium]|nr:transcription termination/antitermination protein NusA [Thermodesulfobacteriaceae bacterium]
MSLELKRTIDQVSREKGLDRNILVAAVEEAVKSAVKKRFGSHLDLEVNFNENEGKIEVFRYRTVVEKVRNQETEIALEEARELDPESEIGDSIGTKMDTSSLGRIAAQSARQVIIQKMKRAERDLIYEEFKDREGEIVNGIVQRYERGNLIVNLGRTEALLPSSEQIPNDSYRRGDRLRAYIIEVRKTPREAQIILSRTRPEFLLKLFELEVPEITEGIVQVMGVVREPGSRSKIAVSSRESDVDPVGACVGMRGSRVQAVVQELRGEKIDIVPWNPDPAKYVYNALAPAECSSVIVDEANMSIEAIVPDEQLSLAIGRQGQNVRLAAKLMGWKIDVRSETRHANMQDPNYFTLLEVPGMTENIADKLYAQGITSAELLSQADPEALAGDAKLAVDLVKSLVEEAGHYMEEHRTTEETVSAADSEAEGSPENDNGDSGTPGGQPEEAEA